MKNKQLSENFEYVKDMYQDQYYPTFLVDKVKNAIKEVVDFLEEGNGDKEEIQERFDTMTLKINDLQEDFDENGSEIETVARDSIAVTVDNILLFFDIDINIEEAVRERDW